MPDLQPAVASTTTRRPVVHLFVGLHKTGSSAIRLMLDFHATLLDRHGFHLPRAAWTRYINRFWNGGHNNVPWAICGHHPVLPEFGTLSDLVAEIEALPEHQHIVFSEDLDYANGAQVESLAHALRMFDVRIVVFLRNQADWLQSLYTEEHKWFTPEPSADWFLDRVTHDRRLHLDALCVRWARPFGQRITIRPYENIRGHLFEAFLECCGAPDGLRTELAARSFPLVNASPDADTLAIIRQASAYARAQGIRPEFFNSVISPALVTAGAAMPRSTRRIPMSAEARQRLQALMTRVNRAVVELFGLALGPEYWSAGQDQPQDLAPAGAVTAERLVEMCLDLGTRAGTRMRVSADTGEPSHAAALADTYYPWATEAEPSSVQRLQDLLVAAFPTDDAALYLERKGEQGVAFQQKDGRLVELRQLRQAEWGGLLLALQRQARLNRVSWNNLREGQLLVEGRAGHTPMWVRHVPTADGELAMIEPVGRWRQGHR